MIFTFIVVVFMANEIGFLFLSSSDRPAFENLSLTSSGLFVMSFVTPGWVRSFPEHPSDLKVGITRYYFHYTVRSEGETFSPQSIVVCPLVGETPQ